MLSEDSFASDRKFYPLVINNHIKRGEVHIFYKNDAEVFGVQSYIEERVLSEAQYIIENGATIRCAASALNSSKSTVHKDMRQRLPLIDGAKARQVRRILEINKAERHIRGGKATHDKYKKAAE